MADAGHSAELIRLALGRHDPAALTLLCKLLAAQGRLGAQWLAVAETLFASGQLELGQEALGLFLAQSGNSPVARFRSAQALNRARVFDAAWAMLGSVDAGSVPRDQHALLRGSIASNLGDMVLARSELLLSTRLNPMSGKAWLRLALIADHDAAPVQFAVLGAADAMKTAPIKERVRYQYALGKVLDDRSDHAGAFRAFSEVARLQDAARHYDGEADTRTAYAALAGANRHDIDTIGGTIKKHMTPPIIVTGLPRSGTTLLEQILTSHSAVGGGDELGFFHSIVTKIGGPSISHLKAFMQSSTAENLVSGYYSALADRFGVGHRIVDKTLEASRYLGVACALLPDSPVIWVRRDPLDNAWSTFRTHFGASMGWDYDLVAMAAHYRLEDFLFKRWMDILGDRILVVEYESLATSPTEMISRILQHCNLPPEPAVLNPERNRRPVTTMSLAQVRRPINASSIGCARPYIEALAPFTNAYRDAVLGT